MSDARPSQPTAGELAILDVLWDRGSSTVRQVHETLRREGKISTGYTTVLKLMQIMVDKGSIARDRSVRPQVYSPARSQRQTQRMLTGDLLDRAFSGSPGNLVLQALATKESTPEERRQIRALLDKLEQGSK